MENAQKSDEARSVQRRLQYVLQRLAELRDEMKRLKAERVVLRDKVSSAKAQQGVGANKKA